MSAGGGAGASPDGELLFVPLGGSSEIGMNLNLYGLDGKWLMIDLGVAFGEERLPGIDIVMPDPSFIEARRDDLLALVLTHGHEDHLGAVPYLWERLQCPVYATPFTAALLRRKLAGEEVARPEQLIEVPLGGRIQIGPFDLEMITVTHSIAEPNAVAIKTRLGTVLHTGDFKIDPEPLVGEVTNVAALQRHGADGVIAMVCDSTNAFQPGESGSERAVRDSLLRLVGQQKERVAVTTFASNIARLETLAVVAATHGRHAALIGRSLWRVTEAAREAGYLADIPPFVSAVDAGFLPPNKVLLICTGCQGEPRGAMARIANGDHPQIVLEEDDLVIFSSKIIPGNERSIGRLHNQLIAQGVKVITEKDHFVHVSGHPSQDELARYYDWVRPRAAVPVHGERRHIAAHAALARSIQVPEVVEPENGAVIRLAPGPAQVVDHVSNGRLALDGRSLIATDSPVLRERRRLMFDGTAFVTLVTDSHGRLLAPSRVATRGIVNDDKVLCEDLAQRIDRHLEEMAPAQRANDQTVREAARLVVRREIRRLHDKRPPIMVELVRV